jgi:hypothetical protein
MTTGEILKQNLKLSKFKYVKIARVLTSPLPIYYVWYDSRRSTIPISTNRLKYFPNVTQVYHGDFDEPVSFAPPLFLEEYNGRIDNRIFICVDLCGINLINDKMFEGKILSYTQTKLDEITLFDLRDKDIVSDTTKKYQKIRKDLNKGANINTKLISVDIEDKKDILFKFLTEATEDGTKKFDVNPVDFSISENPSKTYEIWLKFPNAIELLDLQDKTTIDRKDIKSLLEASDVQIWDSNPSFQYQGFNYWDSQLDASIFPTNIKPKRWNKTHGDGQAFLTKHLAQLFSQIQFFLNPMSSMLQKKLRDEGFLPKK